VAATLNLGADRFRDVLRQLRDIVPMDVLEHRDRTWEIVYGPSYTSSPQPRLAQDGEVIDGRNVFGMPAGSSTARGGSTPPSGEQRTPIYMRSFTAIPTTPTTALAFGSPRCGTS
jgi:hypothetical protein